MNAIEKARAWAESLKPKAPVPRLFSPPVGGASWYGGQPQRWRMAQAYQYWVFVAVRAWMAEVAGGKPPNLGKVSPRKAPAKRLRQKTLGGPREHEEFEPYPPDHPLVRLFCNPNGPDVAYDLWAWTTLFLKLCGEGHWMVVKNRLGLPIELWVIPTHWMRLVTDSQGQPAAYYVQSPWGYGEHVLYEDVVSFYEHSPWSRYEGFGVTQGVPEWIDLYGSMTRTRLATFKNRAEPTFHVKLGESYADPDEAMLNRLYAKWFARFQGENKAGLPLISGPDMDVQALGFAPKEIGFEEGEEQLRDMTLTAFNVPKGVVGLDPTTDTSAYAPQRQFCRFAVNPCLTYVGQVVTEKVIKPVDPEGVFFWDDRVPDDPAMLLNEIASRREGASITPNEERSLFGDEPYPKGGNNPILNGAPVPWVEEEKDSALDGAFERLLGRGGAKEPADGRQFGDQAPPPAGRNGNGKEHRGE